MENKSQNETEATQSVFGAHAFCDAGGKCCADGPIEEISMIMRTLEPGQTLEVRATHVSVMADLGPWTRLTGNEIVKQENDRYLLRRGG
ncbi:MAG: sulfurtransferase TusA family protein [Anaerolineae bacterium]|nr:sulfurtransferase TusA family protein [Anaerolineae bacterium]